MSILTFSPCFFSAGSSSSRHPNQATPKKSGLKNGQMKNKDDECFGDDIEEIPDTDFDFEGNRNFLTRQLCLRKLIPMRGEAVPRSRGIPNGKRPALGTAHDENILESEPIVYRRITVPHSVSKEFCTGTLTAHPTGYSSPHPHFLVLESERCRF